MDFIVVLAKIEPKQGCVDSIVELAEDLVFETLQEDGNIDYQLLQSIKNDELTFIEKWESPEALQKHMASPHFVNFSGESSEFIKNMTVQVLGADELEL